MEPVKVQATETQLSSVLGRVENGEEVLIQRGDRTIAKVVPVDAPGKRPLGFMSFEVPDSFFDPLDEEELAAWE